jgi:hypothetical protein
MPTPDDLTILIGDPDVSVVDVVRVKTISTYTYILCKLDVRWPKFSEATWITEEIYSDLEPKIDLVSLARDTATIHNMCDFISEVFKIDLYDLPNFASLDQTRYPQKIRDSPARSICYNVIVTNQVLNPNFYFLRFKKEKHPNF